MKFFGLLVVAAILALISSVTGRLQNIERQDIIPYLYKEVLEQVKPVAAAISEAAGMNGQEGLEWPMAELYKKVSIGIIKWVLDEASAIARGVERGGQLGIKTRASLKGFK